MALLIFSNTGDWDQDQIGFVSAISNETIREKGVINCIQDFIKCDVVVDAKTVLDVKIVNDELFDLLDKGEYTLWADCGNPAHYVHFTTYGNEWIYVVYNLEDL